MRIRVLAVMFFAYMSLIPVFSQAATTIDDPLKFVSTVYANLGKDQNYSVPSDFYTQRLTELFALEKKEAGGEVGRMDFDFWTNAQDYQLSGLKVSMKPVENATDRQIIIAQFKNGGKYEEIHLYFERVNNRWLLDDARSVQGEQWTLSLILKYGWDGKS
ncbi:MAG: DUF3828 domain-containing protein [Candidatus Riflebacteria bacterium]|nr:DUF3828 domain-containing protein [Candidatus Riflebacteria bacterium]